MRAAHPPFYEDFIPKGLLEEMRQACGSVLLVGKFKDNSIPH